MRPDHVRRIHKPGGSGQRGGGDFTVYPVTSQLMYIPRGWNKQTLSKIKRPLESLTMKWLKWSQSYNLQLANILDPGVENDASLQI